MTKCEIKKLYSIARQIRKGIIGKNPSNKTCFMVSYALEGYLNFMKIVDCSLTKGMVGEWEHAWLTMSDGTIIDATADQFKNPSGGDMPDVYIGEKPNWYLLG